VGVLLGAAESSVHRTFAHATRAQGRPDPKAAQPSKRAWHASHRIDRLASSFFLHRRLNCAERVEAASS
jgi:hypothetical protein